MDEVSDKIRAYVASELLFEEPSKAAELQADTPLLTMIDSLGLTQLVAYIEEEFEIEIDDAEVTADNFRTIGDLSRLVGSKAS
ncbi:MAG TPA: phosphopantetheine-binding protein [Actinomycetota bacterium]